jgi:stage V sporulation protein SpoVS
MNSEINQEKKDESWKKDGFTLRVKGGDPNDSDEHRRPTDPVGLSRSILHVLNNNEDGYVKLMSVGPTALNIAMKGYRIAKQEIESKTDGVALVSSQTEYTAEINGKGTKGICTRVFAIPIKYKQ